MKTSGNSAAKCGAGKITHLRRTHGAASSMAKRSKELKDNGAVRVVREVVQDMVSQDTPLAARFKYAQLCSQLYFSNFPNFQEVFVASKGAIDACCDCCANSPLEQASKSYLTQIYDQIPSLQTGPSPRQAMRWMKIASTGPAPGKSTKFAIPQNLFSFPGGVWPICISYFIYKFFINFIKPFNG